MNWVNELWTWTNHVMGGGDATSQITMAVVLLLCVVLLGSWVQSRIAQ